MFASILWDILLFCIIILLIVYYFVIDRYGYFKRRGIPYNEPVFLLGNTWRNVMGKENLVMSCHNLYLQNSCQPFLGIFQGLKPTVLIRDPQLVEKVLIQEFSNFHDRGIPTDSDVNPLEGSLFNMQGSKWRAMRNKLVPSFSSGKLKGMLTTMQESIKSFSDEFLPFEGQVFEMKTIFTRLNLHIIGTCAFGLDLDTIKNPNSKFPQVCEKIFIRDTVTFVKGVIRFMFPKLAKFFRLRIIPQETNDFFMGLVKDCFQHRTKTGAKRNDFIQLLLELKEKGKIQVDGFEDDHRSSNEMGSEESGEFVLTDEILTAQAFGFFSGGFETTSTALSFLFYLLSKHQDIQDKIRQEVQGVKKKHGGFTYDALKSMQFTEACINESLRLYPPVGVLARKCNKPTKLCEGTMLDEGILMFIPCYSIHRDELYYTDPLSFKPQRFLEETPKNATFLPFGDGPRVCIARKFAILLMKATVAEMLNKYKVETCSKMSFFEPIELKPRAFVTTPKDGLHCVFRKITPEI